MKNGVKFSKEFTSYYLYRKALIKYKKSKKLTVVSYGEK